MLVDIQECHIQVCYSGSIKTLIMLDSLDNRCIMEYNSIVNQQFQAEEEDAQVEW
jgi:hypothetical protein